MVACGTSVHAHWQQSWFSSDHSQLGVVVSVQGEAVEAEAA